MKVFWISAAEQDRADIIRDEAHHVCRRTVGMPDDRKSRIPGSLRRLRPDSVHRQIPPGRLSGK